jgi:RNA polymerase sigma-70 factor (ECF subfamily)
MDRTARVDFDTLASRHKDAVYRQMVRACGNREDAEDVLSDALLNAYRALDQLQQPEAFRAWLAQIARRVCWQLKKREALQPVLQLSQLDEEGRQFAASDPPPEQRIALQQMRELLTRAVESLPASEREVYRLRDLQALPGGEVARRLGISLAAQKSRLHRSRTRIRAWLDRALTAPVR